MSEEKQKIGKLEVIAGVVFIVGAVLLGYGVFKVTGIGKGSKEAQVAESEKGPKLPPKVQTVVDMDKKNLKKSGATEQEIISALVRLSSLKRSIRSR